MIQRSRNEAFEVQDGANRYAEQTLSELESRLKEMAKVVIAGRQELVKTSIGTASHQQRQRRPKQSDQPWPSGSSDLRSMRSTG